MLLHLSVLLLIFANKHLSSAEVVRLTKDEQTRLVTLEKEKCERKMKQKDSLEGDEGGCRRTWDRAMCWSPTARGVLATERCPDYVHGFDTAGNASRYCGKNGTWSGGPIGTAWTNYSQCTHYYYTSSQENEILYTKSEVLTEEPEMRAIYLKDLNRVRIIYNTGHAVSLVLLLVALTIIASLRKLHCARNIIHVNLFLSFVLRAVFALIKDHLLVAGQGFPADMTPSEVDPTKFKFRESGSHWECKFFFSLQNYVIILNGTWIFLEGLYLHNLLQFRVLSKQQSVRSYLISGWLFPAVPVLLWALTRIFADDILCWNYYTTKFHWILRVPLVVLVVVNCIFFVIVIRILATKLNSAALSRNRRQRYRKLARSTLVLIPLFGVYYSVVIFFPDEVSHSANKFRLYFELIFSSWSGSIIAVLFCFINSEVQCELRKKWKRFQLSRRRKGLPLKQQKRGSPSLTILTSLNTSRKSSTATNSSIPFTPAEKESLLKYSIKRILNPLYFKKPHFKATKSDSNHDSIGPEIPREETSQILQNLLTFQARTMNEYQDLVQPCSKLKRNRSFQPLHSVALLGNASSVNVPPLRRQRKLSDGTEYKNKVNCPFSSVPRL